MDLGELLMWSNKSLIAFPFNFSFLTGISFAYQSALTAQIMSKMLDGEQFLMLSTISVLRNEFKLLNFLCHRIHSEITISIELQ